jgi:HEAT repeat protein
MAHFRDLKRTLRELLAGEPWRGRLSELDAIPARRLPGPLFSLLLDREEAVRWRAALAFGAAVARLADGPPPDGGMEPARVVLRQCLWRMNEESGGLGWGIPEAMGETLARNARLAGEFHRVLASFVRQEIRGEGNYLEHVPLRRGVFWALGRLAEVRPELVRGEVRALSDGLGEEDAACRGLAARACGLAGVLEAAEALEALAGDPSDLTLWLDGEPHHASVGGLARGALARLRTN